MAREVAEITGFRRELGERLASFRRAAGVTQAELAAAVYCDRTRVAHLEKGRGGADERFWCAADKVLEAGGLLMRAELAFREALRAREAEQREAELASIRERIEGWRADGLSRAAEDGPRSAGGSYSDLSSALEWLDVHAGWAAGTSGLRVAELLHDGTQVRRIADNIEMRGRAQRSRVARLLAEYYREPVADIGTFSARLGSTELETSILSRPEWIGLGCALLAGGDRMRLRTGRSAPVVLDEQAAGHAVRRLAEAVTGRIRLVDVPIYRLLDIDVTNQGIGGTVGMASFVDYALTMDLLESELVDALADGRQVECGALPLRDFYLPDRLSVFDVGGRMCAGGVLALCAIARPADPQRGAADYVVLVQQRSKRVLNAGSRLAVIPKGFHQPLVDYRAETRIGTTLLRELEEELFGRTDVDNSAEPQRAAAPMHPSRLSAPMRWLTEQSERMRVECTGFGLNLVSGNYEFASLVVIEDEEFWPRFNGSIEANWESAGMRQYSTLDGDLLAELAADESWSNEGVFALLLGLKRLGEIDASRVDVP